MNLEQALRILVRHSYREQPYKFEYDEIEEASQIIEDFIKMFGSIYEQYKFSLEENDKLNKEIRDRLL